MNLTDSDDSSRLWFPDACKSICFSLSLLKMRQCHVCKSSSVVVVFFFKSDTSGIGKTREMSQMCPPRRLLFLRSLHNQSMSLQYVRWSLKSPLKAQTRPSHLRRRLSIQPRLRPQGWGGTKVQPPPPRRRHLNCC